MKKAASPSVLSDKPFLGLTGWLSINRRLGPFDMSQLYYGLGYNQNAFFVFSRSTCPCREPKVSVILNYTLNSELAQMYKNRPAPGRPRADHCLTRLQPP